MKNTVENGKVLLTQHMDYMDYATILEQLNNVDPVYWGIGITSVGLDQET